MATLFIGSALYNCAIKMALKKCIEQGDFLMMHQR
jgi:hypothetical protein